MKLGLKTKPPTSVASDLKASRRIRGGFHRLTVAWAVRVEVRAGLTGELGCQSDFWCAPERSAAGFLRCQAVPRWLPAHSDERVAGHSLQRGRPDRSPCGSSGRPAAFILPYSVEGHHAARQVASPLSQGGTERLVDLGGRRSTLTEVAGRNAILVVPFRLHRRRTEVLTTLHLDTGRPGLSRSRRFVAALLDPAASRPSVDRNSLPRRHW